MQLIVPTKPFRYGDKVLAANTVAEVDDLTAKQAIKKGIAKQYEVVEMVEETPTTTMTEDLTNATTTTLPSNQKRRAKRSDSDTGASGITEDLPTGFSDSGES